jgi:uncharacterized protein
MLADWLRHPWPWYFAGPLIGLAVPVLLIAGNKALGISSSLRHICAACFPAGIPFLKYDWKKESWNLYFVAGILLGGFLGGYVFGPTHPVEIASATVQDLQQFGIHPEARLLPREIFTWDQLLTLPGILLMIGGGFLVGFGTRYAGGCTSGHGIMGLSSLQLGSLIAVISFFVGGIFSTFVLLPILLRWLQ